MANAFEELEEFIQHRMRMSHVYQPVMLMELLERNGRASVGDLAKALLAEDRSQIEYYEEIVKRMPGRVLDRHDVVERSGSSYRLVGYEDLSPDEIEYLRGLCQQRLDEYVERRGDAIWNHRSRASGHISGSLRYEVLKAAGGRCELCGISGEERALDIDHIVPRSRGGTDDLSNLQALCNRCNQVKGNRDEVDFRGSRARYDERDPTCVFCGDMSSRTVAENRLAIAIRDAHPVTEGHSLVLPGRHVISYGELTRSETIAIDQLIQAVRSELQAADPLISGFNIGINDGADAGQTVMHAHVHVIPRRAGDHAKPRGGVRGVIPGMADYEEGR